MTDVRFKPGDLVRWVGYDRGAYQRLLVCFDGLCGGHGFNEDVPVGTLATVIRYRSPDDFDVLFWHNQREASGFGEEPFELVKEVSAY
jgi:hypothetical protein